MVGMASTVRGAPQLELLQFSLMTTYRKLSGCEQFSLHVQIRRGSV